MKRVTVVDSDTGQVDRYEVTNSAVMVLDGTTYVTNVTAWTTGATWTVEGIDRAPTQLVPIRRRGDNPCVCTGCPCAVSDGREGS